MRATALAAVALCFLSSPGLTTDLTICVEVPQPAPLSPYTIPVRITDEVFEMDSDDRCDVASGWKKPSHSEEYQADLTNCTIDGVPVPDMRGYYWHSGAGLGDLKIYAVSTGLTFMVGQPCEGH